MDERALIRSFRSDQARPNPVARQAARERLFAHIAGWHDVDVTQSASRNQREVPEDHQLIARLRAGDGAAFEAIYDRYAAGVLAFCAYMLGAREAAEDALQVTFVSAYRSLRSGEGCVSLRPWLYTIARNCCLSELRARREVANLDADAGDRPSFEGPSEQPQRREQLRELLEDIQRLPLDQRAALVLFELGDHSQAEIATVLGVRREKVKALIFQAREALIRSRRLGIVRAQRTASAQQRLHRSSG